MSRFTQAQIEEFYRELRLDTAEKRDHAVKYDYGHDVPEIIPQVSAATSPDITTNHTGKQQNDG